MLQTVSRAGRVLDLFSHERPEWGASAVARELDIAKSQAHELLVSLAGIGLLQRRSRGRYRLGWRVAGLNRLFVDTNDLGRAAARVMETLAGRYGESLELAVWGPGRAICVAACEGREGAAVAPAPVGAELPGHCTGPGKVLLASRPSDELSGVLARDGMRRMTERTIVSGDRLRAELAAVRRRGFAYEDAEHAPDTCGVAAPIRDDRGDVVAAVGMSVPVRRWSRGKDEYTRALVAAASRVSGAVRTNGHGPAIVAPVPAIAQAAGPIRSR